LTQGHGRGICCGIKKSAIDPLKDLKNKNETHNRH
jgi:hypothetical protein